MLSKIFLYNFVVIWRTYNVPQISDSELSQKSAITLHRDGRDALEAMKESLTKCELANM